MSEKPIKLTQNAASVETDSFLFLNSLSDEDQTNPYQNLEANNNLNADEGLAIYIKAMHRLLSYLNDAETEADKHNKKKKAAAISTREEAKKHYLEFTLLINKMGEIIEEFLRAFAVVHDENAKDFMSLLCKRFEFIQERLQLFHLLAKQEYADDIKLILNRCISTFQKMQEELAKELEIKKEAEIEIEVEAETETEDSIEQTPDSNPENQDTIKVSA